MKQKQEIKIWRTHGYPAFLYWCIFESPHKEIKK